MNFIRRLAQSEIPGAGWANKVADVCEWSQRIRGGPGVRIDKGPDGPVIYVTSPVPQQQIARHPWQIVRADLGATKRISIHPGSIGGLVPTNIFAPLTISGTGVEYVVLTATMTSNAPTSALLSIQATAPTASLTNETAPPAEVHDVLAVLLDGVVYQIRNRNLNVESQLVFDAPVAAPQIGEPNTVPWYRWAVVEGAA